jgi:hypothetical protein
MRVPRSVRRLLVYGPLVLAALAAVLRVAVVLRKPDEASQARIRTQDSLRALVTMMLARRTVPKDGAWPSLDGRSFVLWSVAEGDVDPRDPQSLEVLFAGRPVPRGIGPRDYAGVTPASLQTQRFPKLTNLAGRRNADPDARITPEEELRGTPMLAYLGYPDVAVVAFSDGAVRTLDRKALGLPPQEPIRAGPSSRSPLLRLLSEE